MSSSLFGLISLAGNASLDELRVRASGDSFNFATELAAMLREGTVTLSSDPTAPEHNALDALMAMVQAPKAAISSQKSAKEDDPIVRALLAALDDDAVATSVTASPTPKGFRRSF